MGIKAFGMNEFGWRFMSAIAGTLVAVIVAGMAQVLFGKPLWTFARRPVHGDRAASTS